MGSPKGIFLKNTIQVQIRFATPVGFSTAVDKLVVLVRYFELIVGRQQQVLDIGIVLNEGAAREYLNVDWSLAPQREGPEEERGPHHADLLLSPIPDPSKFEKVLSAYLGRQPEWKAARWRFASKFNERRRYDIDRLIAMANVFDILPDSVFPRCPPIPDDMKRARDTAKMLFCGAAPKFRPRLDFGCARATWQTFPQEKDCCSRESHSRQDGSAIS
jgi:hypothetical protein